MAINVGSGIVLLVRILRILLRHAQIIMRDFGNSVPNPLFDNTMGITGELYVLP